MPAYTRGTIESDTAVSIEAATKRLGCSRQTIMRYIKLGKLRSTKVLGRRYVHKADIDRLTSPKFKYGVE